MTLAEHIILDWPRSGVTFPYIVGGYWYFNNYIDLKKLQRYVRKIIRAMDKVHTLVCPDVNCTVFGNGRYIWMDRSACRRDVSKRLSYQYPCIYRHEFSRHGNDWGVRAEFGPLSEWDKAYYVKAAEKASDQFPTL